MANTFLDTKTVKGGTDSRNAQQKGYVDSFELVHNSVGSNPAKNTGVPSTNVGGIVPNNSGEVKSNMYSIDGEDSAAVVHARISRDKSAESPY